MEEKTELMTVNNIRISVQVAGITDWKRKRRKTLAQIMQFDWT